jgi:hypothetical protein
MTINNIIETRLLEKVKKLSFEQTQQVENFIDSLNNRNSNQQLTLASTQISETVFAKIWDNPEDADYDNL